MAAPIATLFAPKVCNVELEVRRMISTALSYNDVFPKLLELMALYYGNHPTKTRGDVFEVMCREYLLATGQFRHVWLLKDVPQHVRDLLGMRDMGKRDMGMDLVCERWAPLAPIATSAASFSKPVAAPKKRVAAAAAAPRLPAKRVRKKLKAAEEAKEAEEANESAPLLPPDQEKQLTEPAGEEGTDIEEPEEDEDEHMAVDAIEEAKLKPSTHIEEHKQAAVVGPLYCAVQAKYRKRSDKAAMRLNVRASSSASTRTASSQVGGGTRASRSFPPSTPQPFAWVVSTMSPTITLSCWGFGGKR
jgi:hypothetical protein